MFHPKDLVSVLQEPGMEGPPLAADGRHIFRSVSGPAKLFNEFHPVCALEMSMGLRDVSHQL